MDKNSIWQNYIIIGDIVNIRSSDGFLDKRNLFPNIDEILVQENRISFLKDIYNDEQNVIENGDTLSSSYIYNILFSYMIGLSGITLNHVLHTFTENKSLSLGISMSFIFASSELRYALNKHKSKEIANTSIAISRLCEVEINKCEKEISRLLDQDIDNSKIIRYDKIDISEDKDYIYEFLSRENIFEEYGKNKSKLKSKKRKGTLDKYLDLIGCSEEDKEIFLDLLSVERGFKNQNTKSFEYVKK